MSIFTVFTCLLCFCSFVCYSFGNGHFENVALGKDCNQTSHWDSQHPAKNAVNGNTDGTYWQTQNCIHTADSDTSPWWEVNLGRPYPVHTITVWARTNFVHRMSERLITVDGVACYRFPNLTNRDPRNQTVNCTSGVLNGTIVRLSRDRTGGQSGDNRTINLCEFEVLSCSSRYWGSGCDQVCGECRDGAPCDKVTGHCDSGCQTPGKQPPLCTQECDGTHYGQNCTGTCSDNCATSPCDKVSGHCTCKPGWLSPNCTIECGDRNYGQNCTESCSDNCATSPCDKVSGHCTCDPGWMPPACKRECENQTYGVNCSERCGECGDCHHVNGSCDSCNGNFKLPFCKECTDGYFGDDCQQNCSVNCKDSTCSKDTGHCQCRPGWAPPDCNKESEAPTSVIAGSVVGGVVVIVLVVILFICVCRRRCSHKKETDEVDVVEVPATANDQTNPVYQSSEALSSPDATEKSHSKPTLPVDPVLLPRTKPSSPRGPMYENVSVDRDQQLTGTSQGLQASADDDVDAIDVIYDTGGADDVYYNDPIYMTSQEATLDLDRIQQYLLDKLRGGTLDDEFESLPYGHQKERDVGSMEENRPKNRFNSSILPYDATRVVLGGGSDAGFKDYINASYVRGHSLHQTYVAAQAPKTSTVGDFWRMVWQEQITHIVMLTRLKEGEKNKCVQYWPQQGKRSKYSSIDVTALDVEQRADYVIRTFDVKRSGGGRSRRVTQFHYVTWPDHSVPTATALVDFWRTVSTSHRSQQSPSPLLVHCSAGVGRTGSFIALDIAMEGAQKGSEIDIFVIVQRMREDRVNMVQTKSQYRFVHEATLEAYTSRYTRLAQMEFNSIFPRDIDPVRTSRRIDSEFQLLNQMKVLLHKPSHTVAEDEENVGKNRTLDILPDDNHLVYLSSHVRGRNQYINAVFMPTFFSQRGCILTQLPLYHTLVDIWRLVDGYDVTTIVSLGAEVDCRSQADCCYWPRQEGQSVTFGPFIVTLTSRAVLGQHLTSNMVTLQSEDSSSDRELYILHYSGWRYEVPDCTQDLLQLVDIINARAQRDDHDDEDNDKNKVIVQCFDGAIKSGLFRAICDVISRMTYDRHIDVYMAVRHVQIVRPESVASQVQYRYLYHVIQEYQRRNAIYNNA